MFSLLDLSFLLSSSDLDILRVQRIMGFFVLVTHKSMRSEDPGREKRLDLILDSQCFPFTLTLQVTANIIFLV